MAGPSKSKSMLAMWASEHLRTQFLVYLGRKNLSVRSVCKANNWSYDTINRWIAGQSRPLYEVHARNITKYMEQNP